MLSRVADSLYWMARYFERADHCARVIEANYLLLLDPSKPTTEPRWARIAACLGLNGSAIDPQMAMIRLTSDPDHRASIVSCVTAARENASQVREQIGSEIWERLNRLYHELTPARGRANGTPDPLRLVTAVREGYYMFGGVTDATMNHGEGWRFIQLGKYMERACVLSILLDAHFAADDADDLDWVGLLTSCGAFEPYCRVYTADLKPDRIAEFLLLHPVFPYSVRYAADQMNCALESINEESSSRHIGAIERMIGRLRSSLTYAQIDDIMAAGFRPYLNGVLDQCRALHAALHEVYIDYPVESAIEV